MASWTGKRIENSNSNLAEWYQKQQKKQQQNALTQTLRFQECKQQRDRIPIITVPCSTFLDNPNKLFHYQGDYWPAIFSSVKLSNAVVLLPILLAFG